MRSSFIFYVPMTHVDLKLFICHQTSLYLSDISASTCLYSVLCMIVL